MAQTMAKQGRLLVKCGLSAGGSEKWTILGKNPDLFQAGISIIVWAA
jgi:hypothetical protein